MWPVDKDINQRIPENGPTDRTNRTNSDVIVCDEPILSPAVTSPVPSVSHLNAYKSKVHLGTKIELHDGNIVKDLPCPQYMWNAVKSTSRAEKLICTVAVVALLVCIGLVVYFTMADSEQQDDTLDIAPHEWNITRTMWLARPYNSSKIEKDNHLKLVVIQHSVSPECHRFKTCAAELRNLQDYFLTTKHYDIPYNFFIGNDGRVYEGRGWNIEGAHTRGYNKCSLGIGFVGDYREEIIPHATVTKAQLDRCLKLLDEGVQLGYLDPNYLVVGAKDLAETESPGSSLYNELKKWEHYDHEHRYKGKNCTYIQHDQRLVRTKEH